MNSTDYDSFFGLRIALRSLSNLNAIIRERHLAGYIRHESLEEWVILGRFYFDSCGNVWKYKNQPIPAEVFPHLPQVMSRDDFWSFVELFSPPGKKYSFSCSMGDDIPDAHIICPECKIGWTVQNCHDTVVVHKTQVVNLAEYAGKPLSFVQAKWTKIDQAIWRLLSERSIRNDLYIDHTIIDSDLGRQYQWQENERGWITPINDYVVKPDDEACVIIWTYRHHQCHRQNQLQREQEYFQNVFTEAGFKNIKMTPVPNQYCPCDSCAPWFTVIGNGITFTIGWRKRVINIEVKDKLIDLKRLFANEEVTKGPHYIHAWGRKKCVEYLRSIRLIAV